MWEVREPQTVIYAAEKAAEAGNHATAEHLLREAARLQEESLGPRHPDLANTLNNLGIVCEITGKPDDAEQYFRRAVSIARTSLAPDHPFVITSQKNLRDFCESRGKKIEVAAPAQEAPKPAQEAPEPVQEVPEPVQELAAPVEEVAEPVHEVPEPVQEEVEPAQEDAEPVQDIAEPVQEVATPALEAKSAAPEAPSPALEVTVMQEVPQAHEVNELELEDPEVTSRKFFGRLALGALGPISMLMVVLAIGLPRLGAPELSVPSRVTDSQRNLAPPLAAPATAAPVEDVPAPVEPTPPPPSPVPSPTTKNDDSSDATTNADASASTARPVVVRASLCGDLDEWSCDPADRPVPSGPLFFYTQITSPTATTVQHRWYHEGRLLQAVELHVQANRTAGYRTYSRNVMKIDSAGNWRVEVRSKDGALLHEERFTVQ